MEQPESKDLVDLFQRSAPRGLGVDCPPPERIWAAAAGELSFPELRQLVDHSAGCSECSEALQVARELKASVAPPLSVTVPRRLRRSSWLFGLALAAGIAGLFVLRSRVDRSPDELALERGGGGVGAIRSALTSAPQPRAKLVLRWQPFPHAVRYNATLATSDLRVVYEGFGVEQPELAVPPASLTGLSPGTRLVWRVDATLDDGRSVESPAFTLVLD